MVIRRKDTAKLIGVSVIACCAVLVCTMFLNFYMDVAKIRGKIAPGPTMVFYEAQVSTAKVVSMITGGCLSATSVVVLLFYVKHYIDTHRRELGILKALGYSNLKIAMNFRVFGISVLMGTVLGFGGAYALMPSFYNLQNKEKILPEFSVHFHPALFLYLVILPAFAFAALAVCYAYGKLKGPLAALLEDRFQSGGKAGKRKKNKSNGGSFMEELRKSMFTRKKALVFFMVFASFCFSSMTQMAFSMKDLASVMMAVMILIIGLVLACTTMLLAMTTVINGNAKTIAMMKVFGYPEKDCSRAILGGYRLPAYIGFAAGTVYQYVLLRVVVDRVFGDMDGIPEYSFDFPVMFLSLVLFILFYETTLYGYSRKMNKASVKEIMFEKFR